jgi:hypothetical protein
MARIPSHLSALLRDLAEHLPQLLGRNLVAVYLYGSLTRVPSMPTAVMWTALW